MQRILVFTLGFILASALLVSIPAMADEGPRIVGDNGHVVGIEIVAQKGETICIGHITTKPKRR